MSLHVIKESYQNLVIKISLSFVFLLTESEIDLKEERGAWDCWCQTSDSSDYEWGIKINHIFIPYHG